ncbi:sigma-70 family RNA polymerase sigma factor [Streptomyces bathyalis]|uniref:Sigma-70 family RNA polymerase sigma factor n=1 Tax=Streptomyces bathyalis TaxID=2710756 RepID=A0A7T1T322_9ACTN|nr:sigma-70 family RNA polymerase sigma factor [Streptomyces bathyalis]QPP05504.1 sigma-70 family RNA polymerase sigma factor [Streptomyces bathyalis]
MTLRPFEQIVTDHGPMVLRVCRAVVGPVDAEDAWSETFLAALKAYPRLPEDANVEAWLVTIAHRKAIDVARAGSRRPVAVAEVPEPAADSVTGGGAQEWERDGELWDALKALPQRQRAAVAYHYLAGLPYREIAGITGGSTDAARRAAADGIKSLRRSFPRRTEERGEKR